MILPCLTFLLPAELFETVGRKSKSTLANLIVIILSFSKKSCIEAEEILTLMCIGGGGGGQICL